MWIERQISGELHRLAGQFPILVLIGPRQVGKTTLVERVFSDFTYVSLDVPGHAEMAETRPEEFLRRYPPPAILDEVQYAASFFRHLKAEVDRRRRNGLFVLTGSQNYLLMQSVSESLAGRAAVIPFLSLSGAEWAAATGARGSQPWRELLWRGGYPALWAQGATSPSRDRWYQGYVATYLERDVRNLLAVGSLRDFERFLRACAARTAQTLNMAELGRDVGISATTAREWVSVLQASGQIVLLEPYYRSLGKRLAKSPKLYFTDTGLAAFLMGFGSADALWGSTGAGPLFENHVIGQWVRWRDWSEPGASLWYWRNQAGHEVDLVIERNARLTAIEVKLSQTPGPHDSRAIARLRAFYGAETVGRAYIACTTEVPFDVASEVTAVPGWTVWDLDAEGSDGSDSPGPDGRSSAAQPPSARGRRGSAAAGGSATG